MTLTALVAAYGGMQGLDALRPLAGATVLEHQVRRLAAAGVSHVFVLLDDWPAALAAPLARLRADGLMVLPLRTLGEVADRCAGCPRLLLLADACLPDRALLDRLAAAPVPAIATLADTPETAAFERIDGIARWGGAALLDGGRIAKAAAMLGEWDPVSTLLRRAVQEGATRIAVPAPPVLAQDAGTVAAAEARLVADSREAPVGWVDRLLVLPLVDLALPGLFARAIEPLWPAVAALSAAVLGAVAALLGDRWPALLLLLAAVPPARMATRLASVQARALPWGRALPLVRPAALACGAVGLGRDLANQTGQWGWALVAAATPLAFTGLAIQRRLLADTGEADEPRWTAHVPDMPWLLLPFAVAGAWGAGLAAVALYATGSLGWAMRRLDAQVRTGRRP